ncbi:MAG: RNA polymerase sigma-70 factor (ECF subfamily) [Candidatus Azotimanducaceae bacterium]|jgi:RNA polymerase sigma factor (sigma-70 family)
MITDKKIEQLVDRIKNTDSNAEQQFCLAYYNSTLALIRKLVRDPLLAEDLTQETVLAVLLRLREGKVKQPEFLNRYMMQTAKYTVIAWYRRKANQSHASIDDIPVHDKCRGAEDIVFDGERREIVATLMGSMLVARDREVLVRHYLRDEDKMEICQEKNLTSQHFDRVISRARSRCRNLASRENGNQMVTLLEGV